jgi:iron complex transport system substrate-binding protein
VALAPNLTEIVFALEAGDRLVGVSSHSDFPPRAQALPVVGGLTPDLERIFSLRPDLVLATTEGNSPSTVRLLEERGVPVLTTSAKDLRGVLRSIVLIAERLGVGGNGRRLSETLGRRLEAVQSRTRGATRVSAILLVWPSPPQAAGTGTFGDDLLREAGGTNCVLRPGWPAVSPEFLVTSPCRAVVYPAEATSRAIFGEAFASGPLSKMQAIRNGRLIPIDGDLLTRPGPRSFDALEQIAAAFRRLGP